MSLEQIRSVVENFINNTRSELLVLKGDWGVGKTYFWDDLIADSRTKTTIGRDHYARVSAFGINSLDELKSAIAVARIDVATNPKLDSLNANIAKLLNHIDKIPAIEKYVGGSIGTLLHSIVTDTLVCFDDIERKGSGLAITEILGLASLLKEQRNCNVVLIVNDDALEGKDLEEFKKHGEKLIDRQVRFTLTPEESFECVFKPSESYYDLIKTSILSLKIPNIRILQRIHRSLEDMAPYSKGMETKTSDDVIRSLILFVWSYYGEANGAPPLSFVMNYSMIDSWLKKEKKIEESPNEKKWSTVLNSYDYFRTDDIDEPLAQFVETGYINKVEFTELLKKKNDQYKFQNRDESYREAWAAYGNSFDNDEKEFIEGLLKAFRANTDVLAPRDLQSAVDMLRQLGRTREADALIDEYFARRNSPADVEVFQKLGKSGFSDDVKDAYLIAKLQGALASVNKDTRTLAETVKPMALKEGWAIDDVRHMNSFSTDDYYNFFKTERGENFYWWVKKCIDVGESKGDNGTYESIGEKVKQALLRIAAESDFNRIRVTNIYKMNVDQAKGKTS